MWKRSPMMVVRQVRYSIRLVPRRISSAYGWRMDRARMNYSIGRIGAAVRRIGWSSAVTGRRFVAYGVDGDPTALAYEQKLPIWTRDFKLSRVVIHLDYRDLLTLDRTDALAPTAVRLVV